MIGHDHKFVGGDTRIKRRQVIPYRFNHSPRVIQSYVPVHHITQQTGATLRADRHEIRTSLRIIVSF
jgi:hypothetical protein